MLGDAARRDGAHVASCADGELQPSLGASQRHAQLLPRAAALVVLLARHAQHAHIATIVRERLHHAEARRLVVDAQQLVAWTEARLIGRRVRHHAHDLVSGRRALQPELDASRRLEADPALLQHV